MFNGIPEQFHQFIASSRTTLPLPLPLHHVSSPTFSIHDLQPSHQVFQSHLLHQLHNRSSTQEDEEQEEERVVSGSLELEGMRSVSEMMDPWLKEEVLALLTIRSSMGNGFTDFLWGHVSRKLAELGFKRSAEKCKEKFEEVSKYCNNTSYGDNYRSFSELEALFEDQNYKSLDEKSERNNEGVKMGLNLEENSGNESLENPIVENQFVDNKTKRKKRKRYNKLELLKGFSEVVNKIMVQQEEMQMKLLEDMERREEESVAREEAWRKKEMDRLNKEIEIRAHEQALAHDRETTIIEFLKKFTSSPSQNQDLVVKNEGLNSTKDTTSPISPSTILAQNPKSLSRVTPQNNPNLPTSSSTTVQASQNPNPLKVPNSSYPSAPAYQNPSSLSTQNTTIVTPSPSPLIAPQNPNSISNDGEDYGKRWPKEEVYSLINLRCNLYNNVEEKENTKAPLWERISQGMLELGYRRSAKKCKEKWENINKYFRKTKDSNKKRSLDSKTCPYFQQLSSLYNQGRLVLSSEGPENHSESPENRLEPCQGGFSTEAMVVHVDEGEKNMVVQASPYP